MPDERVRVELGFTGGQVVGDLVEARSAAALEAALASGRDGILLLETEDGPLQVVLAHVAYFKRSVRAGHVGFAAG